MLEEATAVSSKEPKHLPEGVRSNGAGEGAEGSDQGSWEMLLGSVLQVTQSR